jgi:hypothetical protein
MISGIVWDFSIDRVLLSTVTLGEMACLAGNDFSRFIREADSDMGGMVLAG